MLGQSSTRALPSVMATPRTSSLMVTKPSPLQSPGHVPGVRDPIGVGVTDVVAVAVADGDLVPVTLGVRMSAVRVGVGVAAPV
jgi:hypothetical protein